MRARADHALDIYSRTHHKPVIHSHIDACSHTHHIVSMKSQLNHSMITHSSHSPHTPFLTTPTPHHALTTNLLPTEHTHRSISTHTSPDTHYSGHVVTTLTHSLTASFTHSTCNHVPHTHALNKQSRTKQTLITHSPCTTHAPTV